MATTRLPVLRGPKLNSGTNTVIGYMNAAMLCKFARIPTFSHSASEGYQRNPAQQRINGLTSELLQRNVDLPTSLLLSLRHVKFDQVVKRGRGGRGYLLRLDSKLAKSEHSLFVVDGQHRFRALERAIQEDKTFSTYKLPFICLIGADQAEEMEQFHIVNSTSKPVPTDLAYRLLRDRSRTDETLTRKLKETRQLWKVLAVDLVERLADMSICWKDRIRFPNESKDTTTITSSAFVRSLKTVANHTALFGPPYTSEYRVGVLDAYWNAIRDIYPDAFANPSKYNIQAGIGATAMHGIFPTVHDLVRGDGGSPAEKESYIKYLSKPLTSISDKNSAGAYVRGVDFWRSGKAGASAKYSSGAGQGVLITHILDQFSTIG